MDTQPKRVLLALLPQHLDYITNLLGTANLRYVDTAPILQDISHQLQAQSTQQQVPAGAPGDMPKGNGAADAVATQ